MFLPYQSHLTSIQSQYEKLLLRFSATSTSFHFVIVKVAKVKSTRFCVVSAYLSGQNIEAEAYCALKRRTGQDKQCEGASKFQGVLTCGPCCGQT